MAFCSNCGKQLADGAKFCAECGAPCGAPVVEVKSERKSTYDGEIHKCPNCGSVLDAYKIKCDICGWELRSGSSKNTVQDLALKLQEIEAREMEKIPVRKSILKKLIGVDFSSDDEEDDARRDFEKNKAKEKGEVIGNFVIPNTKEDILELLQLSLSKISAGKFNEWYGSYEKEAWIMKFKQCDQKAKIMLAEDLAYQSIQNAYAKIYDKYKVNRVGKTSWRDKFRF